MTVSKCILRRTVQDASETLGVFTVYDARNFPFFEVRTLELPWKLNNNKVSCIPTGEYDVIKRISAKYGDHFHILNVPDRDYILIHAANYVKQLLGCIAVGFRHTDIDGDGLRDVAESRAALEALNTVLPKAFKLEIINNLLTCSPKL